MAGEVLSHTILEVNAPEARTRVVSADRPTVPVNEWRFALLLTLAFLLVTIPVALRHEMWRDEVQAWMLARDTSLPALFHALRYEGHPALWYLLLRPFTWLTSDPRATQVVSLVCGAATVYVFGRYAPFSRFVRTLFAFGYFPVYGYTLVARSYALEMLLFFALIALMTRAPRRRLAIGGMMALVANVSIYGTILVIALIGAMLLDAFLRRQRGGSNALSRAVMPCAVAALGVALAVAQSTPPSDAPFHGTGPAIGATKPHDLDRFCLVWMGYVPLTPLDSVSDLRETNLLTSRSKTASVVGIALSVLMVLLATVALRRSALAAGFFVFATVGTVIFAMLIYSGSLYHHGHFFLALVAAAWLSRSSRSSRPRDTPGGPRLAWLDANAGWMFVALLLVQVAGGVTRLVGDWIYPYSEAENVARYLGAHGLDRDPVLVYPGFIGAPIGAYLGRPVYSLSHHALETYASHERREASYRDPQLVAQVHDCCLKPGEPRILVVTHDLSVHDSTVALRRLARFPTSIIFSEVYTVYEIRRVQ